MGFLQGKRLLITGVLSNRSIAYGIAQACKREGAELAFTYVGERFKDRITEIAAEFGSDAVYDMDVTDDAQIAATFGAVKERWAGSTGCCIRSASRRARPSPAIFSMDCRARTSAWRTTSPRTASRRWRRPRCR